MTKESDLKTKIEGVFGKELARDVLDRFRMWPIASYNYTTEETFQTSLSSIPILPKSCRALNLFDVSGVAATGDDGKRVFRLSEFACLGERVIYFDHPINVVATPLSSAPFFLTVRHALLPDLKDVEISVFAWSSDGVAAPNIGFDWRCRVPYGSPF